MKKRDGNKMAAILRVLLIYKALFVTVVIRLSHGLHRNLGRSHGWRSATRQDGAFGGVTLNFDEDRGLGG